MINDKKKYQRVLWVEGNIVAMNYDKHTEIDVYQHNGTYWVKKRTWIWKEMVKEIHVAKKGLIWVVRLDENCFYVVEH